MKNLRYLDSIMIKTPGYFIYLLYACACGVLHTWFYMGHEYQN